MCSSKSITLVVDTNANESGLAKLLSTNVLGYNVERERLDVGDIQVKRDFVPFKPCKERCSLQSLHEFYAFFLLGL